MIKYFLLLVGTSTLAFTSMTCHTPTGAPNNSDTTSHAWMFTITTLGGASGSALYDVAIVNDTDAWAVGEIYVDSADGAINPFPYGAARWNGSGWEVSEVMFPQCDQNGNQQGTGPFAARGIFAFSPTNIWISCDVSLVNWDGESFQPTCMPIGYGQRDLGKLWGTNEQTYLVGTNGFIAKYNGSTWQALTNSNSLNIQDIYGSGGTILAVASYPGESLDKQVLQINGTTVTQLSTNGIPWPLTSVWFIPGHYYVVGQGIYEKTSLSQSAWQQDSVDTVDFFSCVRGNAWNDFFVAGGNGQLLHFNGKSWQSYQTLLGLQSGGDLKDSG